MPEPSPPTSGATDVEAGVATAQAALLLLSDFGPGWSEIPIDVDDTTQRVRREVAQCAGTDADTVTDFGGAIAHTSTFTSLDGDSVGETVSLAASVEDAIERLSRIADPDFARCIDEVYEDFAADALEANGSTLDDVSVGTLNVTPSGQQMVAYRITIVASNSDRTQVLYVDVVVIRSDRVVAGLSFQSSSRPFDTSETERLVAVAASRIT